MSRRIALHLAAGLLSAAIWGVATRIVFVPTVIVLTETAGAWFATDEGSAWAIAKRFAGAIVVGGMWAAIGLLVFGDCAGPS